MNVYVRLDISNVCIREYGVFDVFSYACSSTYICMCTRTCTDAFIYIYIPYSYLFLHVHVYLHENVCQQENVNISIVHIFLGGK